MRLARGYDLGGCGVGTGLTSRPALPIPDPLLPFPPMPVSPLSRVAVAALLLPLAACVPRAVVPERASSPAPSVERPSRTASRSARPAPRAAETALYVVPVEGVRRETLRDSYNAGRSGGRLHRAIDISAPRGTPVVAAASGTVRQLKENNLGGITAVVVTDDGRMVHYYAHLDRYADGLYEGQPVRAGQRLGYVGTTGNAQGPHLHFAAWRIADPQRFWQGEVVNPYAMLRGAEPMQVADAERPARTARPTRSPVDDQVRAAATGRRPAESRPVARPAPARRDTTGAPPRRGW